MSLMERIYCKDFLSMSLREQTSLVESIRTKRLSALATAKVNSKRITKSAMKNITKNKGKTKSKKMLADPAAAAKNALSKLTPEQIASITAMLPKE